MKRIIAIARKEALHILRDPRSLTVAIAMPILMVLLFGYAIDMDMKELPVAILDYDHSRPSRDLITEMTSSGFIIDAGRLNSRDEIEVGFRRNQFRAALVIPKGYARSLTTDQSTPVQMIIDGSDGASAATAAGYLNRVVTRLNLKMTTEILGQGRFPIETRTRVLFNPEMISANFIVPGLTALIMMMICALLTSIALTREKETGTLEQILTTPIAPQQVIIGKLIPYLLIASIDATLVLGIGRFIFDVPMNGSWLVLAGYSLLFLFIALAIGLLISTVARTQQVAMMASLMGTMLPTMLMSGFIFSIASMPPVLQGISRLLPATYYLIIIRGIMLKGVAWFPLEGGILLGMALLVTTVAVKRFKERLD